MCVCVCEHTSTACEVRCAHACMCGGGVCVASKITDISQQSSDNY